MFSIGETLIILAVGSWAFGPKELPRMGRALGKLTGRATGFIYKARAQLFDFAEKAELTKVQQELQMTMQQLQSIRNELQGGINILNPGPLTRQVLGGSGGGTSSSSSLKNSLDSSSGGTALHSKQQNNLPFAASVASDPLPPRDTVPTAATTAAARLGSLPTSHPSQPSSSLLQQQHSHSSSFEVLPISAAAAGLIPDRSRSIPAVSEILADALQEERVAHQALQFFQQPPQKQVVVETTITSNSSSDLSSSSSTSSSTTPKKKRKPRGKKKVAE